MTVRVRTSLLAVALLLAQFSAGPAGAALLVPEEHPTIASALAEASLGDTVSIAPGTYYEYDLVWPSGVSILGRGLNPESVVIDAQYQGRVIGGEELLSTNVLGSLTLRNGDAAGYYGSGLMAIGDPVLRDLLIEECKNSYRGVGLYLFGGATIIDCVLRNNTTTADDTYGGGAYLLDGGPAHPLLVQHVEVSGNAAYSGSGIYYSGMHGILRELNVHDNAGSGLTVINGGVDGIGPTVEFSLFANNTSSGVSFDAGIILRMCTVVGNGFTGAWYGAVANWSTWDHPMSPQILQCIIAGNKGSGISWWDATPFAITCNDVFGNAYAQYAGLPDQTGLSGNLSEDPQFCARGGSLFGIETSSPCAPANNGCGLLIGAFPVSCQGTATAPMSWSQIKSLY